MDPRLIGLGLLVVIVTGLVGVALEPRDPAAPPTLPARSPLFPQFPPSGRVTIVRLDFSNNTNAILAASLQGVVNARAARIYLESNPPMEIDARLLDLLVSRHGVVTDEVSLDTAVRTFAPELAGLVVYDPSIPDSVNVGTTLSGLRRALLVSPGQAAVYGPATGLPILEDLRSPPWAGHTGTGLYRTALERLLPAVNMSVLGYLRPDRHGPRDYLIASRSFVFYADAGPLAGLDQVSLLRDVLAATPANVPMMGWVRTTTGAEENFLVQETSRAGKILVGGEDVPNLSLLSAFPAAGALRQSRPNGPGILEDKVYVSFAIPDGDNLDFVRGRMYDLWREPARGRVPIGWSISPALAELAPAYLELLYADATTNDTFIAGPSGVGYVYPGLFPEPALSAFLPETALAMRSADLRISWLLNTYRAFEAPYPSRVLDAYVRDIAPAGLLLDYGDRPTGPSSWTVRGTPATRSFHYWSSLENLQEKVALELEPPGGPRFLVVALYPFTKDLSDLQRAADALAALAPGRVELVPIEHLFTLLGEWLAGRSSTGPSAGDAFVTLGAEALIPAAGIAASALANRKKFRALARAHVGRPVARCAVAGFSLTGLLVSGTIHVVEGNFWDLLGAAGAVATIAVLLVARGWPHREPWTWISSVLALAAGVGSVAWSAWGLLPLAAGAALLTRGVRHARSFHEVAWVVSSGLGAGVALLLGWSPWLAMVLLAGSVLASLPLSYRSDPIPQSRSRRRLAAASASSVLAVLPLAAFVIPWTAFFSVKLDGTTAVLVPAAVLAVGLAPSFGAALAAWSRPRWRHLAGAGVLVLAAAGLLGGGALLAATLLGLALFAAVSLRLAGPGEGPPSHDGVAATGLTIALLTLARIQPVYYSAYAWAGPRPVEYALYHPLVPLALVAGLAALSALVTRAENP